MKDFKVQLRQWLNADLAWCLINFAGTTWAVLTENVAPMLALIAGNLIMFAMKLLTLKSLSKEEPQ